MSNPIHPAPSSEGPEQLSLPLEGPADLSSLFARVFRRLRFSRPLPTFEVAYRPFAGLRSIIQVRDGRVRAGISDVLDGAPPLVLEALAEILLTQLFRRRPSREARECYLAYAFKPSIRGRIDEVRRQRGSKRLRPARGRCYDLNEIFTRLNHRFFRGSLSAPRLGWSPQRSRTLLGHYDSAHHTITVSRALDSPKVPRYLVEYLVFHEMLHARFPVLRQGHRRVIHSREFREAEKQFPQFEQARRRLKKLGGSEGM